MQSNARGQGMRPEDAGGPKMMLPRRCPRLASRRGNVRLTSEERRGGGGIWDPNVCVPKMARPDFPNNECRSVSTMATLAGEGSSYACRWSAGVAAPLAPGGRCGTNSTGTNSTAAGGTRPPRTHHRSPGAHATVRIPLHGPPARVGPRVARAGQGRGPCRGRAARAAAARESRNGRSGSVGGAQ